MLACADSAGLWFELRIACGKVPYRPLLTPGMYTAPGNPSWKALEPSYATVAAVQYSVRVPVFYSYRYAYICSRLYVHVQVRTCNLSVLSTVHVCMYWYIQLYLHTTQYGTRTGTYRYSSAIRTRTLESQILVPVGDYYYYEYEYSTGTGIFLKPYTFTPRPEYIYI